VGHRGEWARLAEQIGAPHRGEGGAAGGDVARRLRGLLEHKRPVAGGGGARRSPGCSPGVARRDWL